MIYKIAVVDDDPGLVDLITSILEGEQTFAIMTANNGDQALQLCRTYPPHLVLLDLTLPGKDGFSVLRLLKRDRRTASAKVVILTGQDSESIKSSAMKLGADSFMTKPFGAKQLLDEVASLLRIDLVPA